MSYARAGHGRSNLGVVALVAGLHALAICLLLTWKLAAPAPALEDRLVLVEIREPAVKQPPAPAKAEGSSARSAQGTTPKPAPAASAHPRPSVPQQATPSPAATQAPPPPAGGSGAADGAALSGQGTGGRGNGMGSGGGSRPRWISGTIKDSDYPRAASRVKVGGTVVVHFDVRTDGRVSNCRVATSSGNADLDRTTCQLVEQRFRYAPATDATGRAVGDVAGWKQVWWLEPRR
ncbi:hypothetical protein ACFB49_35830 [Sphingomonas sp. DBB INV C78]|uniref:energy transducer TonB n=1 Tax=Sphingomonas sp. DBB INV C78 TaxID=3349434 RepID=UPI0036D31484